MCAGTTERFGIFTYMGDHLIQPTWWRM